MNKLPAPYNLVLAYRSEDAVATGPSKRSWKDQDMLTFVSPVVQSGEDTLY